jgi:hypothetical protein
MDLYKTGRITNFLGWLQDKFARHLKERTLVIIGMGYEVTDPATFDKALQLRLPEWMDYDNLAFHFLRELEAIQTRHLVEFLQNCEEGLDFPKEERWRISGDIMSRTEGKYEETVNELKKIVYDSSRN